MLRRSRILLVTAAVLAAGVTPVVAVAATATTTTAAAAPYCGITWGSLVKSHAATTSPQLTGVRAGRHDCYDRLVFDVRGTGTGTGTGYRATYVSTVTADPSGHAIPLRGGARLAISLRGAAHDAAGRPTYHYANGKELVNVAGYRTFRQAAWAGDFEGVTSVGLGVRARLPFRVFTLPGKLVVDVAHAW